MLPREPDKLMRHQVNSLRKIELFPSDEVVRVLESEHLPPYPLRMIGKVGKTHHRRHCSHSLVSQYRWVVSSEPDQTTPVERICLFAQLDEVSEALVDSPRRCVFVVSLLVSLIRVWRSVDPSRIVPLGRIVHVTVIVELTDFVAEVD